MLNPEQRKKIQTLTGTIAMFRMHMKEAGEIAVKLGMNFRELERQAEIVYDDMRELLCETEETAKTLKQARARKRV